MQCQKYVIMHGMANKIRVVKMHIYDFVSKSLLRFYEALQNMATALFGKREKTEFGYSQIISLAASF